MSKKILFLICLSLLLSACGSAAANELVASQVALTVEAGSNQMPAADAPADNVPATMPSEVPAEMPTEVPTATPLPAPTATTVPSPTPLPVISDYTLVNYYYPVRGEIYLEVELPGFGGDLVGKLNGEALECEFLEDKANHLICTGPQVTYFNSTLYLLIPGTDHVALEFVIYLSPYEVATCGADVTGTWQGIDSHWGLLVYMYITQTDCYVTGYSRYSGPNSTHQITGSVGGGRFYYDMPLQWNPEAIMSFDLAITGEHLEGAMWGTTTFYIDPGSWAKFDRISNTP